MNLKNSVLIVNVIGLSILITKSGYNNELTFFIN